MASGRIEELRALNATVLFRPCDLGSVHMLIERLAPAIHQPPN